MSTLAFHLHGLQDIIGEGNLLTATEAVSAYRVEGQQPLAVAFPGTMSELIAVLHCVNTCGLTAIMQGAGRHSYLGSPPAPIGVLISLKRLHRIIEYDYENLTLTAETGATLAALQAAAAARGQFVPLDPPGSDDATIGGVAATNLAGFLRNRYGAPRDLIIGLRVALANGTLIKTGGKTVKNVAGYEMTKLLVGSFGALGALCEVTVRTAPIPARRAMLVAALSPERARQVSRAMVHSRLEIAAPVVCTPAAARRMRVSLPVTLAPDSLLVMAGLLGDEPSVDRQLRELRGLIGEGSTALEGDDAAQAWQAVRELPYPTGAEEVGLRAAVPLTQVQAALVLTGGWECWWALADVAGGRVWAGGPADLAAPTRIRAFRAFAESVGGYCVLGAAPLEMKRMIEVWGRNTHADLMRRLKESYDPQGIFGGGRLV